MNPLSPHDLLATLGPLAMLVVLFAETGLLIGFFLPGDSILFTAGLLTATTTSGLHLALWPVLVLSAAGALIGAQVGFVLGRRGGPRLLDRARRPRLAEGAERAAKYLDEYGVGKAVVIARFVPIVRTVMNPMAGALGVDVRRFSLWQVVGGLGWTTGLVLAGRALGTSVPSVDKYLLPVIAVVVAVSLLPIGVEVAQARRRR
jgi:membrane-associated protein